MCPGHRDVRGAYTGPVSESEPDDAAAHDAEATERDEQLLAQALYAQVGLDMGLSDRTEPAQDAVPAPDPNDASEKPPLPTRWVLLLALLLGLAAGAVVGLLSLF